VVVSWSLWTLSLAGHARGALHRTATRHTDEKTRSIFVDEFIFFLRTRKEIEKKKQRA
jgi:hypothetical protein